MRIHALLLPLMCLAGCRAEGGAYVFLDDLCSAYAEDICAARAHCCDAVADDCNASVSAACLVIRRRLENEAGLTYNADFATDVRAKLVSSLDDCKDPFLVPRFFSGALADGSQCSDDLECTSGACVRDTDDATTGACTKASSPLCPAP